MQASVEAQAGLQGHHRGRRCVAGAIALLAQEINMAIGRLRIDGLAGLAGIELLRDRKVSA